ncbi:unnamed protein product [Rhodiola kirilowii]
MEAEAIVASIDDESQCRMCGGKRQSPSQGISSRTKKPRSHDPISGYTAMKLPIEFSAMNLTPTTSDSPSLQRCVSDPSHPPSTNSPGDGDGPLRRCISDPSHPPSTNSPARGGGLPPLYPGSTGLSPDSLRLKRMRQRMKEMAQWWVDVVHEDDNEENHNAAAAPASLDASDKELEEQVSVEKIGDDGLKIKLRCPCGSGYELLISGHCCYYKII